MNIKEKCSPGRPRRVENEGLEPSGALPGAMWAQGGRQERSKWLLGAARGAKTNYWLDPGPPRGEKLIDFRVPGGSPEGSGGAPGWYFWTFFGHAARGTKKQGKITQNNVFLTCWVLAFYIFSCAVWLPGRGAGGRVDLEKPLKFVGFVGESVWRAASKTRKPLPKSNENRTKNNEKRTHEQHTKTSKKHQKTVDKSSKMAPQRGC